MTKARIFGLWQAHEGEFRWAEEHLIVRRNGQLWQVWAGGCGLGPASFKDFPLATEDGYFENAEDAMLGAEEHLREALERQIASAKALITDLQSRYDALLWQRQAEEGRAT